MARKWIIGAAGIVLTGSIAALAFSGKEAPPAQAAPHREVLLAPPAPDGASLADLERATKAKPGEADGWVRLGNRQLRDRRFAAAIAAYEKGLALDPKRGETWSALGEAYIQSDKSDTARMPAGAAKAFARALEANPRDLRARFYRTMERDFSGQHDRAVGEWLAMLGEAPMGSDADEAIRAALAASINRNLAQVKAAMAKATQTQPRIATTTKG